MNKNGEIVIVEDDQLLLEDVFISLNYINRHVYFSDRQSALEYLKKTSSVPFLILSDMSMPKLDGFELKTKLHTEAELQRKCIPHLFFSIAASQRKWLSKYIACQHKVFYNGMRV
jgi:CheY-like chemotaxis protein